MAKDVVTCTADIVALSIYIRGILHLRLPRDPLTKVQAWIDSAAKTWVIEIWCAGHKDQMVYDNPELWESILEVLDKNL